MNAIIDILHLDFEQITIIKNKYPDSTVLNPPKYYYATHKYVVVIPKEEYNNYCNFLLEHGIVMSSDYCLHRIKHDKIFADKIKTRSTELVDKL